MTYSQPSRSVVGQTDTIHPLSAYSIGLLFPAAGQPASAAWPAANRAIFVPFVLPDSMSIVKVRWYNGSGVNGNVDCGVYDAAGTRLFSTGSTAQSGTSQWQAVDIADVYLPGRQLLYMALASSSATGAFGRWTVANVLPAYGVRQLDTAFALPATVSGTAASTGYLPVFSLDTVVR